MQITKTTKVAAMALALVGSYATGCTVDVDGGIDTSPSVPQDRVERIVTERLTETVGQRPDSVSCENGLDAVIDASVRCTLTADGATHGLTARVTGIEGESVKFDIQVDDKAPS